MPHWHILFHEYHWLRRFPHSYLLTSSTPRITSLTQLIWWLCRQGCHSQIWWQDPMTISLVMVDMQKSATVTNCTPTMYSYYNTYNNRPYSTLADSVLIKFGLLQSNWTSKWHIIVIYFIILDSESTVYTYNNPLCITNIRHNGHGCLAKVHTNSRKHKSTSVGDAKLFNSVWYNQNSLTNILSLVVVRKHYNGMVDTKISPTMYVDLPGHNTMTFHNMPNRMY